MSPARLLASLLARPPPRAFSAPCTGSASERSGGTDAPSSSSIWRALPPTTAAFSTPSGRRSASSGSWRHTAPLATLPEGQAVVVDDDDRESTSSGAAGCAVAAAGAAAAEGSGDAAAAAAPAPAARSICSIGIPPRTLSWPNMPKQLHAQQAVTGQLPPCWVARGSPAALSISVSGRRHSLPKLLSAASSPFPASAAAAASPPPPCESFHTRPIFQRRESREEHGWSDSGCGTDGEGGLEGVDSEAVEESWAKLMAAIPWLDNAPPPAADGARGRPHSADAGGRAPAANDAGASGRSCSSDTGDTVDVAAPRPGGDKALHVSQATVSSAGPTLSVMTVNAAEGCLVAAADTAAAAVAAPPPAAATARVSFGALPTAPQEHQLPSPSAAAEAAHSCLRPAGLDVGAAPSPSSSCSRSSSSESLESLSSSSSTAREADSAAAMGSSSRRHSRSKSVEFAPAAAADVDESSRPLEAWTTPAGRASAAAAAAEFDAAVGAPPGCVVALDAPLALALARAGVLLPRPRTACVVLGTTGELAAVRLAAPALSEASLVRKPAKLTALLSRLRTAAALAATAAAPPQPQTQPTPSGTLAFAAAAAPAPGAAKAARSVDPSDAWAVAAAAAATAEAAVQRVSGDTERGLRRRRSAGCLPASSSTPFLAALAAAREVDMDTAATAAPAAPAAEAPRLLSCGPAPPEAQWVPVPADAFFAADVLDLPVAGGPQQPPPPQPPASAAETAAPPAGIDSRSSSAEEGRGIGPLGAAAISSVFCDSSHGAFEAAAPSHQLPPRPPWSSERLFWEESAAAARSTTFRCSRDSRDSQRSSLSSAFSAHDAFAAAPLPRVLVVDGNALARKVTALVLRRSGFDVAAEASDGAEAVAAVVTAAQLGAPFDIAFVVRKMCHSLLRLCALWERGAQPRLFYAPLRAHCAAPSSLHPLCFAQDSSEAGEEAVRCIRTWGATTAPGRPGKNGIVTLASLASTPWERKESTESGAPSSSPPLLLLLLLWHLTPSSSRLNNGGR